MLTNRLRCAWAKFHAFRQALVDKNVDTKLRLRLFNAVVTPTALYGLIAAPLTAKDLESLVVVQRKMIRSIVGHVKLVGEDWADVHRRMNCKIAGALERQAVPDWAEVLLERKESFRDKLETPSCSNLLQLVFHWNPKATNDSKLFSTPHRQRGRPCSSWKEFVSDL